MEDTSIQNRRRKRVKVIKALIILFFLIFITIPVACAIYLGCALYMTNNELMEMSSQYEAQLTITDDLQQRLYTEENERIAAEAELSEAAVSINLENVDSDIVETESGDEKPVREVYLTFDDGPSIYTEQILDILDEYGVKATFFVTGEAAESFPERYQAIYDRGHTLAMHSYSHIYKDISQDKDRFVKDFNRIRDFVKGITGEEPVIYRFPGGSSNTVSQTDMDELCEYLNAEGVKYFDWNVSSGDASRITLSSDRIVANCLAGINNHNESVVLMHDTSTKYTTVAALPTLLETLSAMEDVEVLPITADTVAVQHKELKEAE